MKTNRVFISLLAPYKAHLWWGLISIVAGNLLGLVFPWMLKVIVDEVIVRGDRRLLQTVVLWLVLAAILKLVYGFLREYLAAVVGEGVARQVRNKLYWHLHRLSVPYLDRASKGALMTHLLDDTDHIKEFLAGGAVDCIYGIGSCIFVAAVLLQMNRPLALITFAYLPVFAAAFVLAGPRLKATYAAVSEKQGQLSSRIQEVLSGMRVVAGFFRHRREADIFDARQVELSAARISSSVWQAVLWTGVEFLSSLGIILVIWYGAGQAIAGKLSTGTLMAFYSYMMMLFFPWRASQWRIRITSRRPLPWNASHGCSRMSRWSRRCGTR